MNDVTVVIPNRAGETPMLTIQSLYKQRYQHFDIILVNDFMSNANMARNHGLSMVKTEFVLFSDNDINWYPLAIEQMHTALLKIRVSPMRMAPMKWGSSIATKL